MNNDKLEQQFLKHLLDLASKSYNQNMFTFSEFCGLPEQDVFWSNIKDLSFAHPECFGGRENADRVMIRFGNPDELGYTMDYPITLLKIAPLMKKFSDDLSHRDFLGAIMNLGIERDTIGDIQVGEKEAYLFCKDTMADFIIENLTRIRHTQVSVRKVDALEPVVTEEPDSISIQVSSMRIDAVIAKVYNISRNECLKYFTAKKVFVNGRCIENNDRQVKAEETVNVRGFGKFTVVGDSYITRKGKIGVTINIYR